MRPLRATRGEDGQAGEPQHPSRLRCPQAHSCSLIAPAHPQLPTRPKVHAGRFFILYNWLLLISCKLQLRGLKRGVGTLHIHALRRKKYSSELPPFKLRCSELKACQRAVLFEAVLFEAAFHLQISWLKQEHKASKPPLCRLRSVPFKGLRKGRADVGMPSAPAPHLALRHQAGISLICP